MKHGGFVRQNCSYFPISMFQYTEIQKYLCIQTWRIATDDENILGCESGDEVLPIYEKNRVRKSHATFPL